MRTPKEAAGRVLPEDAKKVALPSAAPPLSGDGGGSRQDSARIPLANQNQKLGGAPLWAPLKRVPKKILSLLSNLPLAIGEMFTIAALMALGTAPCPLFFFLIRYKTSSRCIWVNPDQESGLP